MDALRQDLRVALRTLGRDPRFAAAAILILALGIGATAAIFTVTHDLLLRPLPYPDPDRLVIVWENDRIRGTQRESASMPDLRDLRASVRSLERLDGWNTRNVTLTGSGEPERLTAALVTTGWFDLLGVAPKIGRAFLPEESEPGRDGVVILGEGIWRRRFGADPAAVGREILIDGTPHAIIGVMPPEAHVQDGDEDAWLPWPRRPEDEHRGVHNVYVFGRLRTDVTLEEAQAELTAVMARLEEAYPEDNKGRGAWLQGLHETLSETIRPRLALLLAAAGLVLLIGCANVANLLLARAAGRQREIAVRAAVGAGRWRVVRQLLTESAVLSAAGGAAGLLLAHWGLDFLRSAGEGDVAGLETARIGGWTLAFCVGLSLASGVLCGLAPALRLSRRDLVSALHAGGHAGIGDRRGRRTREALVTAEVALTVILLAGAGLLLRSLAGLGRVDPGYEPDGLVAASVSLPESTYPRPEGWPILDWPRAVSLQTRLLERVRALPGVTAASFAMNGPNQPGWTTRVTIEGRPAPPQGDQDEARYRPVGAGYFRTIGARILRGREITEGDVAGAPRVVVVNDGFARKYFGEQDPLGQRIRFWGTDWEIVGVARDVRFLGLGRGSAPAFYPSAAQNPPGEFRLIARSEGEASGLVPAIRSAVSSIDPGLAVFSAETVPRQLRRSMSYERFTTLLATLFAAAAILLAAVGIYAVASVAAASRVREMGVRMALGAGRRDLLWLILGQGMTPVAIGVGIGLAAGLAATRWMSSLLFGVSPSDAAVFLAAPLLVVACALAAAWVPARRAAAADPLRALRAE